MIGSSKKIALLLGPLSWLLAGVFLIAVAELLVGRALDMGPLFEVLAGAVRALVNMSVLAVALGVVLGVLAFLASMLTKARVAMMLPRPVIVLACCAPLTLMLVFLWGIRGSESDKPDVFIIVVDTMRADFVSAERTPNFASLAEDGLEFKEAYAESPWTLPSFSSFLSGLHPDQHCAGRKTPSGTAIRKDVPLLPEIMRKNGYQTVGLVSNMWLSPKSGLFRGFDYYMNLFYGDLRFLSQFWPLDTERYAPAELQLERALMWMRAAVDETKPVFMLMHFMDPHRPYAPPLYWKAREYFDTEVSNYGARIDYGAEVRRADAAIGKFVGALKRSGRYRNAMIFLTADHGEELPSDGRVWEPMKDSPMDHGHSLLPEVVRVPLIIKLPGEAPRAKKCSGLFTLLNISATVTRAMGFLPMAGASGAPLVGPDGGCGVPSPAVFQSYMLYGPNRYGVRIPHYTTIWNEDRDNWRTFDRIGDPRHNEALATTPDELKNLIRSYVEENTKTSCSSQNIDFSPEELEQLRGLGYLE